MPGSQRLRGGSAITVVVIWSHLSPSLRTSRVGSTEEIRVPVGDCECMGEHRRPAGASVFTGWGGLLGGGLLAVLAELLGLVARQGAAKDPVCRRGDGALHAVERRGLTDEHHH